MEHKEQPREAAAVMQRGCFHSGLRPAGFAQGVFQHQDLAPNVGPSLSLGTLTPAPVVQPAPFPLQSSRGALRGGAVRDAQHCHDRQPQRTRMLVLPSLDI